MLMQTLSKYTLIHITSFLSHYSVKILASNKIDSGEMSGKFELFNQ